VTRDAQVVQYNVVKNNFVSQEEGDGNHDDGIQAFLFNVGTGILRDVVVRGNIIIERESEGLPFRNPLQGIGFFDGPLVGFTVEGNVVCVGHWHGVSLYDAEGATIRANVCYSPWGGRMRPWIMLGQKKHQPRGNTVQNNFAHTFNLQADAEVHAENNREVDAAIFQQRLQELADEIARRFGKLHALTGRPRIEMEQLSRKDGEKP
jgi:hypothetical protein